MSNWTLWIVLAGVPLILGGLAQLAVKRTFAKYSEVSAANGMSGADAAAAVLRASGLPGLTINPIDGHLTDHYDPRSKTLNLSADVGQARSVAAIGVAAHEAGHAIQDAKGYWPMTFRQTLVPAANVGSTLWFMPVFLGFIFQSTGLVTVGLVLFAAVVLFQLITLPVEFDASHRALVALEENNLLAAGEIDGARAVLRAASLTYVAGFVAALGQLIYFFIASRG
jgi:Zn-dependent membrane protease YugP